jgi:hypothetical protein
MPEAGLVSTTCLGIGDWARSAVRKDACQYLLKSYRLVSLRLCCRRRVSKRTQLGAFEFSGGNQKLFIWNVSVRDALLDACQ